jgi:hypothetical protein
MLHTVTSLGPRILRYTGVIHLVRFAVLIELTRAASRVLSVWIDLIAR